MSFTEDNDITRTDPFADHLTTVTNPSFHQMSDDSTARVRPPKGSIRIDENGIRRRHNGDHWKRLCRRSDCDKEGNQRHGFCYRHLTQYKNSKLDRNNDTEDVVQNVKFEANAENEFNYITETDPHIDTQTTQYSDTDLTASDESMTADTPPKGTVRIDESGIRRKFDGKRWKRLCRRSDCDRNGQQGYGLCCRHFTEMKSRHMSAISRPTNESEVSGRRQTNGINTNAVIEVNDVFEELSEENKRLLNELTFADKVLRLLIDYKPVLDQISHKIKSNPILNELQMFEDFHKKVNELIDEKERQMTESVEDETNIDYEVIETEENVNPIANQNSMDIELTNDCIESTNQLTSQSKTRAEYEFECEVCHKRFAKMKYLKQHSIIHQKNGRWKRYACDHTGCEYKALTPQELADHKNTHLSVKPFQCFHCDRVYCTRKGRSSHMSTTHVGMASKRADNSRFKTKPLRRFVCSHPGCDYKTMVKKYFDQHQKVTHTIEPDVVCPHQDCGRRFKNRLHLNCHILMVHSEKTIVCEWPGCEYRCSQRYKLVHHMRLHSANRAYVCQWPGCDKSYKYQNSLAIHVKKCHTMERPYRCHWPGCEYSCVVKQFMDNHESACHSVQRPHHCDWPNCGKSFKTIDNLKTHRSRIHQASKKYCCDWPGCDYRSVTNAMLKLHMNVHNKDKR